MTILAGDIENPKITPCPAMERQPNNRGPSKPQRKSHNRTFFERADFALFEKKSPERPPHCITFLVQKHLGGTTGGGTIGGGFFHKEQTSPKAGCTIEGRGGQCKGGASSPKGLRGSRDGPYNRAIWQGFSKGGPHPTPPVQIVVPLIFV